MTSTEAESPSRTPEQTSVEKTALPSRGWKRFFGEKPLGGQESDQEDSYRPKSTLGILSDRETDEVPGE